MWRNRESSLYHVIDYRASYHDAELLRKLGFLNSLLMIIKVSAFRRQFDLANKEAMDESAEWRLKFDEEKERAIRCMLELTEVKGYHKDTRRMKDKLDMLQKSCRMLKSGHSLYIPFLNPIHQCRNPFD